MSDSCSMEPMVKISPISTPRDSTEASVAPTVSAVVCYTVETVTEKVSVFVFASN